MYFSHSSGYTPRMVNAVNAAKFEANAGWTPLVQENRAGFCHHEPPDCP